MTRNGWRWLGWQDSALLDENENVIAIIGVGRDITDRLQAEVALIESEERFRALVEKSPLGISLIGEDGRYKYINPQFTTLFGYTAEDIPTGNDHPSDRIVIAETRKESVSALTKVRKFADYGVRARWFTGEKLK